MELVIIGTGNTATVLGRKLKQAEHTILQVVGRDIHHASSLAELLEAKPVTDFTEITKEAEVYLLAVPDDAIAAIALKLPYLAKRVVAHTAASVTKETLNAVSENYGVFYPLQTLRKEVRKLPEIPIVIDGNNADTIKKLRELAETIASTVLESNDEKRVKMHLAAVMVNNFGNHLYALAENYCKKENIDFHMLKPLMIETAMRISDLPPSKAQTGPAIRNDQATIDKHLQLLEQHPQLKDLYSLMTKSIQQFEP